MNDFPKPKDIIHIYYSVAEKGKFFVCLDKKYFLIINSKKPITGPKIVIEERDYEFLTHDSYIHINELHNLTHNLENNELEIKGTLTSKLCIQIKMAVDSVDTLLEEDKSLIRGVLSNFNTDKKE